jgi:hypothetical protein
MLQRARGCGPERLRAGELVHAELLPFIFWSGNG